MRPAAQGRVTLTTEAFEKSAVAREEGSDGPMVKLEHVSHTFRASMRGQPDNHVVDDVSLDVERGSFVAIVGPSGCGKSTLLNMIAGLITPSEGRVMVKGEQVAGISPDGGIGFMFAHDALLPWRTTLDNVAFGPELRGEKDAKERAREMLKAVDLADAEQKYRSQLSSGMRQRAALARTLVNRPDIILLDEPFGALDAQTRVFVMEEFVKLRDVYHSTTILVTHDLMEAIMLADTIAVMTARPTSIKRTVRVPIPRPRSLTETRFDPVAQELFTSLWADLSREVVEQEEQV